jgi:hypothetical protein
MPPEMMSNGAMAAGGGVGNALALAIAPIGAGGAAGEHTHARSAAHRLRRTQAPPHTGTPCDMPTRPGLAPCVLTITGVPSCGLGGVGHSCVGQADTKMLRELFISLPVSTTYSYYQPAHPGQPARAAACCTR